MTYEMISPNTSGKIISQKYAERQEQDVNILLV